MRQYSSLSNLDKIDKLKKDRHVQNVFKDRFGDNTLPLCIC